MAAANTDKLKKLSKRWVGQIGAAGVADNTTTTIPLASVTNLATDTAVVATIDRVDANGTATPSLEETVIGVVSGSNLVNCVRASEGTAQAHNAGAVVEILVTAKGWNDIVDWGLVEHSQLGVHDSTKVATPSTVQNSSYVYAADSVGTDAYAITLSPVPSAYATGQVFHFKAGTANTGACTLNVNTLGAKTIKKLHDQDLADNDIEVGQIVTVVYDGTNFQMQSQVANTPSITSKVIASTRDTTAASGDVAYTGVGFPPTSIHVQAHIEGTHFSSYGFADSAKTAMSTNVRNDSNTYGNSDKFITIDTGVGAQQVAIIKTYDSDGFTLTWTKAGSPTGTAQLYFLCYK
jgi:hypothetical protein